MAKLDSANGTADFVKPMGLYRNQTYAILIELDESKTLIDEERVQEYHSPKVFSKMKNPKSKKSICEWLQTEMGN